MQNSQYDYYFIETLLNFYSVYVFLTLSKNV